MAVPLIQVTDFCARVGSTTLVDSVSFSVAEGSILGIVGESGSGKSVTCMGITKLLPSNIHLIGKVIFQSKVLKAIDLFHCAENDLRKLRGKEISYVFQEPMTALNPVLTCGYQVSEAILAHEKLSKSDLKNRVLELFREVKLPDVERIFSSCPHQISGGQRQRVMIAMAIANNPRLLIADEPTTALDASVQKSIINLLESMVKKRGMAMIFISHDLNCLKSVADEVLVMYKGKVVEEATASMLFTHPKHPYTRALMQTRASYKLAGKILPTIPDLLLETESGEFHAAEFTSKMRIKNTMGEAVLEVRNLGKTYAKKSFLKKVKPQKPVIESINFTITQGETLGIVGESGCGKSTLAKILTGLETKNQGEIEFFNSTNGMIGRQVQMVFQDPFSSLNPSLKAGEAIMEPMSVHRLHPKAAIKSKAIELLNLCGLTGDFFDKYPHQMSGGQRQRVCIARALSLQPNILILDESVAALDVSVQSQILNLLKDIQLKLGLTYLFISHDLNVVGYMADNIMVLKDGSVEETGKTEKLMSAPESEYTRFLIDCMYET